jgi:hypothetical protein
LIQSEIPSIVLCGVVGSAAMPRAGRFGVFVRKGGTKPDLASVDGFKRSLLAAKSIAYVDPSSGGASGIYIASLLERLGITAEMKPKTKLSPPAEALYASVAAGEADMGFNQISEVLAQPTVEFAGGCRQRFRTTPSSPLLSLAAAVRLTLEERWSRSFPRLPPRPF